MLGKVKQSWQQVKCSTPDCRFQERYVQRQRECKGKFNVGKLLNIVAGIVITAVGIFFGVIEENVRRTQNRPVLSVKMRNLAENTGR
jgi:hypothetical protein